MFERSAIILAWLLTFVLVGCSNTELAGGGKANKKSDGKTTTHEDDPSGVDTATKGGTKGGSEGADPGTGSNSDNDGDGNLAEDGESCISLPAGGGDVKSKESGGKVKTTVFHRSVATDPGKTGADPATGYPGYKPYTISPDSELAVTEFRQEKKELIALLNSGVSEIEYFAFAHQFGKGLDRIKISIDFSGETLTDTSNVNIYSAYGYLSIKNLKKDGDKVTGDVEIKSFNYDPAGTGPLFDKLRSVTVSAQDASDIVGPASEQSDPKVSKKGADLSKIKVTIGIDAQAYDTVQYRAIRANLWSVKAVKPCIK